MNISPVVGVVSTPPNVILASTPPPQRNAANAQLSRAEIGAVLKRINQATAGIYTGSVSPDVVVQQGKKDFVEKLRRDNPRLNANVDLGDVAGYSQQGRVYLNTGIKNKAQLAHTLLHESLHHVASEEGETWLENIGIANGMGGRGSRTNLNEKFIEYAAQRVDKFDPPPYSSAEIVSMLKVLKEDHPEADPFKMIVKAVFDNDLPSQQMIERSLSARGLELPTPTR